MNVKLPYRGGRRTRYLLLATTLLLSSSPWLDERASARAPGARSANRETTRSLRRVTLAEALALARKNNRMIRVAHARIGEAKGDLEQASVLLVANPEIGVGVGPRFMTASRGRVTADIDAYVEQSLELGGQRSHRRARARANLRAVHASVADTKRVIALAVALLFYRTLAARDRVTLLRENVALASSLLKTTQQRVTLGAGNQLDLNASRLRVAEAKRKALAAAAAQQALLLRLATVCGLPAGTRLRLRGSLPVPQRLPSRASLARRALRSRPDLKALSHRIEAANAAVKLAKASAWPNLSLGVSYSREESSNAVLFTLKVSLPLFNRNQGRRSLAVAKLRRIKSERSGAALSVSTDVRLAWVTHRRALKALQLYSSDVLLAQKASVQLLRRSFQEGKVGYVKVLLVQRELLAGREGYLTARLAHAESLARLRAATCLPQVDSNTAGGN